MTYQEATDWLFKQIPNYQNTGGNAYKPGLERISGFLHFIGEPHLNLKVIHVAGTNGKGSVCHMTAAALQANNYKVGLFTSPHIFDFTERIKVNGSLIPQDFVAAFVDKYKTDFLQRGLSFFEITAALAFDYFNSCKVDFAIIETGLGGRLDATNVVDPLLSVITKIGIDHTQFLGNTIKEIAGEKAGIIKVDKPVVLGDSNAEVIEVVSERCKENNSQLYKVDEKLSYETSLLGQYQLENLKIVEKALEVLSRIGITLALEQSQRGLLEVNKLTKFCGRFQIINKRPTVIIDVAHNPDGIRTLKNELAKLQFAKLHLVFGGSKDKDLSEVFQEFINLPAAYYLTEFSNSRSTSKTDLEVLGKRYGLNFEIYDRAENAYHQAIANADEADCVVVCGSFFLLSDLKELKDEFFQ